jgi:Fe-S cluster assembly iron-binding protein IscA
MRASNKAVEKLKDELVKKFLDAGLGYRVTCTNSRPDTTTVSIRLDRQSPGDEVLVSRHLRILLDPRSAILLRDRVLDYSDGSTFCLKDTKEARISNRAKKSKAV